MADPHPVAASGVWTRPGTYDRAIVRDSELYLELDPGPADVLLDLGANIGAVTSLFLERGEYDLLDSLATLPRCIRGVAIELHFDKPDWRLRLAPRLIAGLERQGFVPTEPPELTGRARMLVTWLR